jgi:hypothetical protein
MSELIINTDDFHKMRINKEEYSKRVSSIVDIIEKHKTKILACQKYLENDGFDDYLYKPDIIRKKLDKGSVLEMEGVEVEVLEKQEIMYSMIFTFKLDSENNFSLNLGLSRSDTTLLTKDNKKIADFSLSIFSKNILKIEKIYTEAGILLLSDILLNVTEDKLIENEDIEKKGIVKEKIKNLTNKEAFYSRNKKTKKVRVSCISVRYFKTGEKRMSSIDFYDYKFASYSCYERPNPQSFFHVQKFTLKKWDYLIYKKLAENKIEEYTVNICFDEKLRKEEQQQEKVYKIYNKDIDFSNPFLNKKNQELEDLNEYFELNYGY